MERCTEIMSQGQHEANQRSARTLSLEDRRGDGVFPKSRTFDDWHSPILTEDDIKETALDVLRPVADFFTGPHSLDVITASISSKLDIHITEQLRVVEEEAIQQGKVLGLQLLHSGRHVLGHASSANGERDHREQCY